MFARTLSLTHITFKNDFTITTLLHLVENMVHLILNESLTIYQILKAEQGGRDHTIPFIIPVTKMYINKNELVPIL